MADYHKLQSVKVQGYKSIRDQEIKISNLNVLIGQNGAGKSNFISLFEFLKNIINQRLQFVVKKAGGADQLLYYGGKTTDHIFIHLDFYPNLYRISLIPTAGDTLFIQAEDCGYWRNIGANINNPYWSVATRSKDESILATPGRTTVQQYTFDALKNWRVYHFHDTSESSGMKKYSSISDNAFLFEDASNIAAYLYFIRESEPDYYIRIVKTVQLVVPFFKNFSLRPNPLKTDTIILEWQDQFSEKIFPASVLSDGSLRFICMATLLLQKNLPMLIILDEPELGLHPTAITVLAGLLRKASSRSQIIISTQSVNLVNEFEAEDIIVVDRNEGESVFNRLDPDQLENWLNTYSLGDIWEKNVIGGAP